MSFGRLLIRNLLYHWRGNLAILLGVVVGTAVLTGALFVGDSLRGSLRDLTERRLGWVEQVLLGPRFIRSELADRIEAERIAPVILLQGTASTSGTRAARVTILGVDDRFWGTTPQAHKDGLILSMALAKELRVQIGDPVTLGLQKVGTIPRETVLGRRDASDVVGELKLAVSAIEGEDHLAGSFALNPTPAAPFNAFVPLATLQTALEQPGRVNALLAKGDPTALARSLRQHLTLDDWGLILSDPEQRADALFDKLEPRNSTGRLRQPRWRGRVPKAIADLADADGILTRNRVRGFYRENRPYLSVESRQMLLEPALATGALKAAEQAGLRATPTLVYLANTIADAQGNAIPYSVVAGLDPTAAAPLGPFLPPGAARLGDDEIVLAGWAESPLKLKPGDPVTLKYFLPEIEGRLEERSTTFRLAGLVPLFGPVNDPDLTPDFPGITDKLDLRDWNPPFPYDNRRIQPRDEEFWRSYRTTPKAYVTLATGQRLWGSRFGDVTSIRLSGQGEPGQHVPAFRTALLDALNPETSGLGFDSVRQQRLEASGGGTDFGGLFLGFSFFLIVAALLLVGLLFRLNLDRRATEIGLLLAIGFRVRWVRRLLLAEGSILAFAGVLCGSWLAVVYARLLLALLSALWPGGLEASFLRLHTTTWSFVVGGGASFVTGLLTIAWATRILSRSAPRALLAGETTVAADATQSRRGPRWSWVIAVLSILGAVLCMGMARFVHQHEALAMTFFGSGALLLTACLATVWIWMTRSHRANAISPGRLAIARLGIRNAARHPARSLLTAGLLAAATFLIVAVESFHRDPGQDFLNRDAGSGGFALLGESNLPIFQDLNSPKGRDELQLPASASAALAGTTINACRLRTGDDASCLNLYQPRRPRVLGVPRSLIDRGGFHFAATTGSAANPWALLLEPGNDGTIPAFADATTAQWTLKSQLGGVLEVPNDKGEPVRLRLVGLLLDSIFQSELVIAEENFVRLYPSLEGHRFFMIETPADRIELVERTLESQLSDRGFEVTTTTQRLAAYLAVENTYLTTFQALGGLGLLLGALGLAVVLVRSIWERRGELALLRALGFRRSALGWLVLAENAFLLILGLASGAATASVAVAPHLLGGAGAVPWLQLVGLLSVVLLVGLLAAAGAMAATLRAPLLPALRRE